MFTILIIVIIICTIMMSKKDKHDAAKDREALSKLPPFTVTGKPMGTFSKILNLAVNKNQLIHSFSYSNAAITVTMQSGTSLSAYLSELFVDFEKNNGTICYSIKGKGRKIQFYQTTNISNKEWDAINSVLCFAGSTRGRDMFSKQAKVAGYVNIALKAIKAIS